MRGQKFLRSEDVTKAANEFFRLSKVALCKNIGCIEAAIRSLRFRMVDGLVFAASDQLLEAQNELVIKCAKALGAKKGHEGDIESLIWKTVSDWLIKAEDIDSEVIPPIEALYNGLDNLVSQRLQFIAPNFLVQLKGPVEEFSVGAVRIVRSERIAQGLTNLVPANLQIEVTDRFNFAVGNGGISVYLMPISWIVEVGAAKGNAREEALWLIDVATSLLRLSYRNPQYAEFPRLGDREAHPISSEPAHPDGITVASGNVQIEAKPKKHSYLVDSSMVEFFSEPSVREFSDEIMAPNKGSLAERLHQGLGWLTRGRRSEDRAERILYFFTAIESLLSNSERNTPIIDTIARHAAVILSEDNEARHTISQEIRNLYSLRSAIVHAGKRDVLASQTAKIQFYAESLYYVTIWNVRPNTPFQNFHEGLRKASYGSPWAMRKPIG